jgi:hypothetical protein
MAAIILDAPLLLMIIFTGFVDISIAGTLAALLVVLLIFQFMLKQAG